MLEGLRAPLKTGDSFELVLKFRRSGDRKVKVDVQGGTVVSLSRLRSCSGWSSGSPRLGWSC